MNKKEPDKKKEESEVEGSLVPQKMVKRFKQLKKSNFKGKGAVEYWAEKINPKIYDMLHAKKVTLLTIASDKDQAGDRGRINTLMYGDPGTAKSDIMLWLSQS